MKWNLSMGNYGNANCYRMPIYDMEILNFRPSYTYQHHIKCHLHQILMFWWICNLLYLTFYKIFCPRCFTSFDVSSWNCYNIWVWKGCNESTIHCKNIRCRSNRSNYLDFFTSPTYDLKISSLKRRFLIEWLWFKRTQKDEKWISKILFFEALYLK